MTDTVCFKNEILTIKFGQEGRCAKNIHGRDEEEEVEKFSQAQILHEKLI